MKSHVRIFVAARDLPHDISDCKNKTGKPMNDFLFKWKNYINSHSRKICQLWYSPFFCTRRCPFKRGLHKTPTSYLVSNMNLHAYVSHLRIFEEQDSCFRPMAGVLVTVKTKSTCNMSVQISAEFRINSLIFFFPSRLFLTNILGHPVYIIPLIGKK